MYHLILNRMFLIGTDVLEDFQWTHLGLLRYHLKISSNPQQMKTAVDCVLI